MTFTGTQSLCGAPRSIDACQIEGQITEARRSAIAQIEQAQISRHMPRLSVFKFQTLTARPY